MNDYSKQVAFIESKLIKDQQSLPVQFAIKALIREICLSPKPGLVDMNNNGAHRDMNFQTFIASIEAISCWFEPFYQYGIDSANKDPHLFLTDIRPIGIQCEQAMYHATHQINTHKGGIFAFGLLLGAIGRLTKQQRQINIQSISNEVSTICQGIVDHELKQNHQIKSVGEKLFKLHNLSGARGEAESGYATAINISLPIYNQMQHNGYNEEDSLLQALLYLLAYNQDTNLVSRGGLEGLNFVKQQAKQIILQGGITHPDGIQLLTQLDDKLIERNLSPGGSADLIAITWFLSQY